MVRKEKNWLKKSQCGHCGKLFDGFNNANNCHDGYGEKVWYDKEKEVCYTRK